MPRVMLGLLIWAAVASPVRAEELVFFGAGSLREVMTGIVHDFAQLHGVQIRTEFGPSGRMHERIEHGERADVFASADVGHPRKLVEDGRAQVMAVFATNTLCLLAPQRLGITPETALDRLLAPGLKLGISPAKVDPLGDYTVELFHRLEALRPGAETTLRARAVVLDTPPGSPLPPTGDADADAVLAGRVDASIVYCSGRARYARLLPNAAVIRLPAALQLGPQYALAVVVGARPEAMLLALTILAPAGQRALAEAGFTPVGLPDGN